MCLAVPFRIREVNGPEAVAHFAEKLDQAGCMTSKGTIRIPWSEHLPLELIAEIAAWCRDTGNHA